MKSLFGVVYALVGAVVGGIAGFLVALAFAKVSDASNREGAVGYFAVALAIIGALIGLGVGIVLYARSAPAGQTGSYGGSAVFGVFGMIAVIVLGVWGWMNTREAPLEYDGALANLELELRIASSDVPATVPSRWLDVEVQTATTRPVGTVLMSSVRTEGNSQIFPVVQGPMYRAARRTIVVRIEDQQTEVFVPDMKRTPDRKADWSEWIRPQLVDPPYGVVPSSPLRSKVELRYRVRAYGD